MSILPKTPPPGLKGSERLKDGASVAFRAFSYFHSCANRKLGLDQRLRLGILGARFGGLPGLLERFGFGDDCFRFGFQLSFLGLFLILCRHDGGQQQDQDFCSCSNERPFGSLHRARKGDAGQTE